MRLPRPLGTRNDGDGLFVWRFWTPFPSVTKMAREPQIDLGGRYFDVLQRAGSVNLRQWPRRRDLPGEWKGVASVRWICLAKP